MVGTYYAAPAPGEPPFVKVGDEVAAGETLCIVEAMKLMNEIAAEEMGTVREVCLSRRHAGGVRHRAVLRGARIDPDAGRVGDKHVREDSSRQPRRGGAAHHARRPRAGREDGGRVLPRRTPTPIRCSYADEAVCIGPAQSNKSYLVMASIIAAAKNTGCRGDSPRLRLFGRERGVRPRLRRQRPRVHRPVPGVHRSHGRQVVRAARP